MSRKLDDLDSRFKPVAMELLARCTEISAPVLIITTGRTVDEQKEAVANKVSWTMNSKHLPQPPEGKSLAIDICPFDQFMLSGPDKLQWDEKDPVWQKIGAIGVSLGLKWGVVIKGRHCDLGHFEYITAGIAPSHGNIA